MLNNLIRALGNVSSNTQLGRRELLAAAGIALAGCGKEAPTQEKEPEIPPIVTEHESELEQIAGTNVYHTSGVMVDYNGLHIMGGTSSKVFADHKKTSIGVHEVLVPGNKGWQRLGQRMPKPRWDTTAYVHDNKIYVVGGEGPEGSYTNAIFTFDWKNGWQTLGERFPVGIRHATAVICDDTPFITGGFIELGDGKRMQNPFIYKQVAPDKWKEVAEIPEPGRYGSVAGIDGHIYLLGGFFGPSEVIPHPTQIYNTRDPSWTTAKTPGRLITHQTFNRNNMIMVHGYMVLQKDGKRQSINPGLFEYSPKDSTWAYVKSFNFLNLSGKVYGNVGDQVFVTGCKLYQENTGLAFSGKINHTQRQQIS